MTVSASLQQIPFRETSPVSLTRARAIADANHFRALAREALRDGAPKAELRAANARAAVRSILAHVRCMSAFAQPVARSPKWQADRHLQP